MTEATLNKTATDPFEILGLADDAGEQTIRARYLELVKKFPPDREPDRFHEIQAAYQAARDPLILARRLINQCNPAVAPAWETVLTQYAKAPPPMTLEFLLSLGNQVPGYQANQLKNPTESDANNLE